MWGKKKEGFCVGEFLSVCLCVRNIVVNDMTVLHCMVIVTLTIFININQAEKI